MVYRIRDAIHNGAILRIGSRLCRNGCVVSHCVRVTWRCGCTRDARRCRVDCRSNPHRLPSVVCRLVCDCPGVVQVRAKSPSLPHSFSFESARTRLLVVGEMDGPSPAGFHHPPIAPTAAVVIVVVVLANDDVTIQQ